MSPFLVSAYYDSWNNNYLHMTGGEALLWVKAGSSGFSLFQMAVPQKEGTKLGLYASKAILLTAELVRFSVVAGFSYEKRLQVYLWEEVTRFI